MVTLASTLAGQPGISGVTWHGSVSLDEREAMIRVGAYYRYLQRGCIHGHDLEDWLAAETELDFGSPEPGGAGAPALAVQQSSLHGAAKDDELKRLIKQHPRKAIPQIESVEPQDAPLKE